MNLEIVKRLEKFSRVSHTVLSHRDSASAQRSCRDLLLLFGLSESQVSFPNAELEKWKHTTLMIQKSDEKTTSNVEKPLKTCKWWDKPPTSTDFWQHSVWDLWPLAGSKGKHLTWKVQSHKPHEVSYLSSNPGTSSTLVGGFNPFEKSKSKFESSPSRVENIFNTWNHHLVHGHTVKKKNSNWSVVIRCGP